MRNSLDILIDLQTIVVRGKYYNLTGMPYRCWVQKSVTAYNLLKYIAAMLCPEPAEVAQIHQIAQNLFFPFIDT
jgi:hypothetical protein